jgi:hypothetical protein
MDYWITGLIRLRRINGLLKIKKLCTQYGENPKCLRQFQNYEFRSHPPQRTGYRIEFEFKPNNPAIPKSILSRRSHQGEGG